MKFLAETWYLFAAALVSGSLLLWPILRKGMPANGVSCLEAVQMINRQRALVIDVRDAADYAQGHIVNSKNVMLANFESATGSGLPKNKALPVVVLCGSGARASRAVMTLRRMGYERAHTLTGGIAAWREANLPLEKNV